MATLWQKLMQEKADLVAKGKAVLDLAETEGRDLSAEDTAALDAIDVRMVELGPQLAAVEAQRERERTMSGVEAEPDPVTAQRENFRTWGEQLQAVMGAAAGRFDPRLQRVNGDGAIMAATGMSEGIPADGGFLVQTDFATELLRRTYDSGQVAGRCRRIPISANSNGLKINGINETSRADGSRWGGVLAYWKAEAGHKVATAPTFRKIQLDLKKLIGLCYATDELLQDASALGAIISQAFAEEFAFKIDDAVIEGTGAGQPLGILNSGALVTQAAQGGQLARTIVIQNVVNMWSRLDARSKANAVWFVNTDVTPELHTLTIAVGTGGAPVYMPPGGLADAPYGRLYGRPVIEIEQCSTLGTVGDIILADMSQYLLIDKGGMDSASSIHVKFDYDETVFRFVYRVDGQPTWAAPVTPFKDAATTRPVSPWVVLATRA